MISVNLRILKENYKRGIRSTDEDGVAAFNTNFPCHYDGRAIHQHTIFTHSCTILPHGNPIGDTVNHIGYIFFDECLRSAVEAVYPYNTNTQAITSNDEDTWAPVKRMMTTILTQNTSI
jgi:protocatechuate 3,4-dioxygenase beta subunit